MCTLNTNTKYDDHVITLIEQTIDLILHDETRSLPANSGAIHLLCSIVWTLFDTDALYVNKDTTRI